MKLTTSPAIAATLVGSAPVPFPNTPEAFGS